MPSSGARRCQAAAAAATWTGGPVALWQAAVVGSEQQPDDRTGTLDCGPGGRGCGGPREAQRR